jgi:hypothetical protein
MKSIYIVLEFCDGGDLNEKILSSTDRGYFTEEEVIEALVIFEI